MSGTREAESLDDFRYKCPLVFVNGSGWHSVRFSL